MLDTMTRHNDETQWLDTMTRHNGEKQQRDTMINDDKTQLDEIKKCQIELMDIQCDYL